MSNLIPAYIILGVYVGYRLSASKQFALGEEATLWDRIFYGISISGVWPIVVINYLIHYRKADSEEG